MSDTWSAGGRHAERHAADEPREVGTTADHMDPSDPDYDRLRAEEAAREVSKAVDALDKSITDAFDPWNQGSTAPSKETPSPQDVRDALEDVGREVLEGLENVRKHLPDLPVKPRPLVSQADDDDAGLAAVNSTYASAADHGDAMGDEDETSISSGRPAERSAADTPESVAKPSDWYEPGPIHDDLLEAEPEYDPWAVPDARPSPPLTQEKFEEGVEQLKEDAIDWLRDVDEAVPGLFPRPAPLVSEVEPEVVEPEEYVSFAEPATEDFVAPPESDWATPEADV